MRVHEKIMPITSEGLPQKLKCIKMGRDHEERGFQAFLKQPPLAKRKVRIERDCLAIANSQIILRAS